MTIPKTVALAFNSVAEIAEYVATLKGTELVRVAREIDLPGRSKLNASETRTAIRETLTEVWEASREAAVKAPESDTERRSEVVAQVASGYRAMVARDAATVSVVPNRADKRKARKRTHKRNDGRIVGSAKRR